jgi:hypothetical protein
MYIFNQEALQLLLRTLTQTVFSQTNVCHGEHNSGNPDQRRHRIKTLLIRNSAQTHHTEFGKRHKQTNKQISSRSTV